MRSIICKSSKAAYALLRANIAQLVEQQFRKLQVKGSSPFIGSIFEVWLSLVERCVRDAEVAGSNPVTSTTYE